ncbi:hypothetical protein [Streptomyces sp. 8P21H-1]|uniref:hypothetical protein n=1 Tax=Streptomyces sp. 8P21H-1 TaxID=2737048 RepID=UPI00156D4662|nr:hypothetical protein [Streptomyces sp. 8P21H-1]NSL43301.1 hypothetical protein [Streptomyces sp. 8P21H-1]
MPCREVEEHLPTDPRVVAAAVLPLPHPLMGEQACSCVVIRNAQPGLTLRQ